MTLLYNVPYVHLVKLIYFYSFVMLPIWWNKGILHQLIKCQQNRTLCGWVIDDSTNIPALFWCLLHIVLRSDRHHIRREQRPIICAPNTCYRFHTYCFISKPERVKGDRGRKSMPNFGLFTPVKIRRAMGEVSEWVQHET